MNAVDGDGATPLHLAVRQGAPVEPELVKTLLRHAADLEARDKAGNTPLAHLPCAQVRVCARLCLCSTITTRDSVRV
mgnify:CR=1 FL=1